MYKYSLWLLKLGVIPNLYFFYHTLNPPLLFVEAHFLLPAQILFLVSAYRCFFPVSYATNAVLHDSFLSSIFFTRLLATLVEISYIYQFSYLIRLFNQLHYSIVEIFAWLMVVQVCISQCFVWCAILMGRLKYYFYEEAGWFFIFLLNTISSVIIFMNVDLINNQQLLIKINLLFGFLYLPWQLYHLKAFHLRAKKQEEIKAFHIRISQSQLIDGFHKSINYRMPTTKSQDWGGVIGMTWMLSYWAVLIPGWLYFIIQTI